jgi:hypothetical protein
VEKSNARLQEINKVESTHQQLACVQDFLEQHFLEHSFLQKKVL